MTSEIPLTPADLPPLPDWRSDCGALADSPERAAMRARVEQYRRECEARWVLRLPFAERRPWLAIIGQKRGEEGRRYLEVEVIRQYRLIRQMERP